MDGDLVIEVAQALGSDKRTQLERVSVGAYHGVITLAGRVGSAAVREAAAEIATSVSKVRGVANFLQAPNVVIDAQEDQVLEPPIGGQVYATDMNIGHVETVIVNPHNRRVTAFVVHGYYTDICNPRDFGLLDQPERRTVVPIHSVGYETENSVELLVSGVEISQNEDFNPLDFVSPPVDWEPPYPYQWGDVLFERKSENE